MYKQLSAIFVRVKKSSVGTLFFQKTILQYGRFRVYVLNYSNILSTGNVDLMNITGKITSIILLTFSIVYDKKDLKNNIVFNKIEYVSIDILIQYKYLGIMCNVYI